MARAEAKPTQLPLSAPLGMSKGSGAGSGSAGPLPRLDAGEGGLAERVGTILDLIRPAVQADGGDLELVEISPDGVVRIRLHGACIGCPSAAVTLQAGVERNLKEHIPEIVRVESVD